MNTATLNMYMFLSNTGFTRRNTLLIFVRLRPRNTWTPIQHVVYITPWGHVWYVHTHTHINMYTCIHRITYILDMHMRSLDGIRAWAREGGHVWYVHTHAYKNVYIDSQNHMYTRYAYAQSWRNSSLGKGGGACMVCAYTHRNMHISTESYIY